jgi:hypothetical protein
VDFCFAVFAGFFATADFVAFLDVDFLDDAMMVLMVDVYTDERWIVWRSVWLNQTA